MACERNACHVNRCICRRCTKPCNETHGDFHMVTLLLVYFTHAGALQTIQVPGFTDVKHCKTAAAKIVGDIELAAEYFPTGSLTLISERCIEP